MCETEDEVEVEQTEFTFDELEGRARERALEKMREWAVGYGWADDTRKEWATETLPNEWCIYGVDHERMWFDCDRGGNMALTNGWVDLDKLVKAKPELFENWMVRYAAEQDWLVDPQIDHNGRNDDVRGINGVEWRYPNEADLQGTPFDGADLEELRETMEPLLVELDEKLSEYARDAAAAVLKELSDELEYLYSDENAESMAEQYTFDEDGEVV